MKQLFTLIVILQFVCQNSSVFAEEDKSSTVAESDNNMIVLHLDDKMNKILLDLFVDVFGNNPDNSSDYKIELPMSAVAELYHNYTQEQLNSLRTELKKLDNRFDIVRQRVDSLQKTFLLANIEYALTKNLSQYERHFIHIGENVITLQKLVLKFTNGEKPIDINSINRNGRKSVIGTVFDKLARLLLGVTTESTDSQQNSQFLSSNQLNKLAILMRSLQSLKNVSTEQLNPKIRSDVTRLQTMLYRLQQIQELNRLSQERTFLHSSNMNPYGYEAILNLVKIMGTGSGQNQLRALLRLFTTPMTTTKVKPNNRLSHEKIRTLMRALEEQEKQRRQQLETQRQKQILEELLMNQRRQQEQIDSLIRLIQSQNKHTTNHNNMNEENNHHNHQSNHNGNSNGNNKGYNEHQSHHNNHNNHNENNHQTQSHKNVSPTMNINEIFDNHMNNIWQNQRTSTTTHRYISIIVEN